MRKYGNVKWNGKRNFKTRNNDVVAQEYCSELAHIVGSHQFGVIQLPKGFSKHLTTDGKFK